MLPYGAMPVWMFVATMVFTVRAYPCSIVGKISSVEMVNAADAIVRARAVEYAVFPKGALWTTGTPDSKIRFQVIETIRGPVPSDLILPGYLVDRDDFNDHQPPYKFVRPNGRAGSCFANSYRSGGQFLLFLKKTKVRRVYRELVRVGTCQRATSFGRGSLAAMGSGTSTSNEKDRRRRT